MAVVAVFGSGSVETENSDYTDAYQIGRWLGNAGFTVMTGVSVVRAMEAANRGGAAIGARVIGVTYDDDDNPPEPSPMALMRNLPLFTGAVEKIQQ